MKIKDNSNHFNNFAKRISDAVGRSWCFVIALSLILVWLITGPLFNFSDTWQLIINTGTTIITFLMVFLIQNTQNRDTKILNLKIDELIKSKKNARKSILDLDKLSDEGLKN
ncbi:low affinity iron permease family protein [Legionella tunisiensis]|uniref:low affinity iron permease family protein n=1 Tax=Legionella tunisiensis TaxID=1034944 RepID=UPI00036756AD|nr:low affinity iron permease family protein [Legionella tunisiensis]